MTITYNQRYPADISEVKNKLNSLLGNDLIILQRQGECGQTYHKPIRTIVQQTCNDFVVCKNRSGKRESFNYSDFYSGNLIYDIVEVL